MGFDWTVVDFRWFSQCVEDKSLLSRNKVADLMPCYATTLLHHT